MWLLTDPIMKFEHASLSAWNSCQGHMLRFYINLEPYPATNFHIKRSNERQSPHWYHATGIMMIERERDKATDTLPLIQGEFTLSNFYSHQKRHMSKTKSTGKVTGFLCSVFSQRSSAHNIVKRQYELCYDVPSVRLQSVNPLTGGIATRDNEYSWLGSFWHVWGRHASRLRLASITHDRRCTTDYQ